MRKIYKTLILIIGLFNFLTPLSVQATHVLGAEIEWQYLRNDSFEIIVHAYRDCNGIPLTGTNLTYQTTGDTCASTPVDCNAKICCGIDITPICAKSCDRCQSSSCSFSYGIQEFTITAIVLLPTGCCNYTIAWQENGRSSAITTGAANYPCYLEAYLNRCLTPKLSSPFFSEPPITIFCVNQCTVLNSGVVDNDVDSAGRPDSISYSFGYPQSAQGMDIAFNSPYTYNAPLIYAGPSRNSAFVQPYCYGFHLDSTTGDIEFKATKSDISVYVLVIDIYRKNSKGVAQIVGEIKRDLEILAISCPANHPPVIPGINGGNAFSIKICSGQETCFNVEAFDLDPSDTDQIAWNNPGTMKGANFSVVKDGKKWPTAVFCWTPKDSNISTNPYIFTANTTDNACPIPGRGSRAFSIYVTGAPPLATYSASQKCGLVSFQASPSSSSTSSIANYLWTGDSTPGGPSLNINSRSGSYQYTVPGKYHYTLTITGPNGCTNTYKDSVIIPKIPGIKLPKDTTLCSNTELIIIAIPSNYSKPYSIAWNIGDTGAIIHYYVVKDTELVAGIKDATGCTLYDSMKVKALPLPAIKTIANQSICYGDTISIGGTPVKEYKYMWASVPSGFTSTLSNPNVLLHGTTIYILKGTDTVLGCSKSDTVTIKVNPLPQALSGSNSTICNGGQAQIGSSSVPGHEYSWTSSPSGFASTLSNPVVTPNKTTTYNLTETILATGCHNSNSVTVTVSSSLSPNAHWFMNYQGNNAYFHALDSSLADPDYSWTFGDGNNATGHSVKHLYSKNQIYNVSLIVTSTSGCTDELDSALNIIYSGIETVDDIPFLLSVYPNPFSSSTMIQYTLPKLSKVSIGLFDLTGRQIAFIKNETLEAGEYKTEINSEKYHLNPGVYFLKVMSDDGFVSRQIVKF